ncbi:MAG: SMC-Scp complex subunit ScpB, partial [Planctomycetota bacterium]
MSSHDASTPDDSEESADSEADLDLFSQLQEASKSTDEELDDDSGELTLEQLSASYAEAIQNSAGAENLPEDLQGINVVVPGPSSESQLEEDEDDREFQDSEAESAVIGLHDPNSETDDDSEEHEQNPEIAVTPTSIIETMLFVGCPDNAGLTATQLAKTMRGVSAKEVDRIVNELNASFSEAGRALRIVESTDGYRMDLAEELEVIRDRFYGQQREIALNQSAIDCLALVAYQPGISREKLEDQRSQPSGGVLNQLVRRQLLEMKREK